MIEAVLSQVKTTLIEGVSFEISDFFTSMKEDGRINDFSLKSDDDKYVVTVETGDASVHDTRSIFLSFSNFVSYQFFSCYQSDMTDTVICYDFITVSADINSTHGQGYLAFRCILKFMK